MSESSQSAATRELVPYGQYAKRKRVSTKTLDRWVAAGILPKPDRINNRKYFEEGTEPRRDSERAA
jgi:DNA-binding transcriptional MerR regulator